MQNTPIGATAPFAPGTNKEHGRIQSHEREQLWLLIFLFIFCHVSSVRELKKKQDYNLK